MSARTEVEAITRSLLADKLAQCTEAQRDNFARCYPNGVPDDRLLHAIDLCNRTLAVNAARPSDMEIPK